MFIVKFAVLLLISTISCHYAEARVKRSFHLLISSINCTTYSNVLSFNKCTYTKLKENTYGFNNVFILSKDMDTPELQMHVYIDMQQQHTKNRIRLLDVSVDACKSLLLASDNVLIRSLLKEMRRSSNLPFRCPFKANQTLRVDNFTINQSYFPPYTPNMNFTFQVDFFDRKQKISSENVRGSVTKIY